MKIFLYKVVETLSRRFPAEDFAGTLVGHFLIGGELLIRDQGKVSAFGQVVADATVLAFAGPAFPGAVGTAEKDLEAEVGGEGLVLGHLLALVVSEAETELGRDVDETASEGLTHASGVFSLQRAEHGVTRVVRSTSTPTAERLPAPKIKSPS